MMQAPTEQFQRTSKTREQSSIFEVGLYFVLDTTFAVFNLKNGHLIQQSAVLPANDSRIFTREGNGYDENYSAPFFIGCHSKSYPICENYQMLKNL